MMLAKITNIHGKVFDSQTVGNYLALVTFVKPYDNTYSMQDAKDLWTETQNQGGSEQEIAYPYNVSLEVTNV